MSDENLQQQSAPEAVATETVTESTSFIDSLPEDLRTDPSLADFKDVTGLAKSYVSSQRMLGNSIRIPSEEASAEAHNEFLQKIQQVEGVVKLPSPDNEQEVNQFYQKLGKPETAEQYNFEIGDGTEVDTNAIASFKDMAHKLNLTNAQANEIVKFELQREQQYQEQFNESKAKAQEVLRQKWGQDYDNRIAGAKAALSMYEDQFPEAVAELKEGGLGNNAAVVSMLSELYSSLKESGASVPASTANAYGMSSEEAKFKIDEIMTNKQHAYWSGSDIDRKKAVEYMAKLNNIAYGE